jgi:hypothetical protein
VKAYKLEAENVYLLAGWDKDPATSMEPKTWICFSVDILSINGATLDADGGTNKLIAWTPATGDVEFGNTNYQGRPIWYKPDFSVPGANASIDVAATGNKVFIATDSALSGIDYNLLIQTSNSITLGNNYTSVDDRTLTLNAGAIDLKADITLPGDGVFSTDNVLPAATANNIVLGADVTISANGGIYLDDNNSLTPARTVNSDSASTPWSLTLNSSGATRLGVVGGTNPLAALITDGAGAGTTTLNGNVTTRARTTPTPATTGAQSYGDPVNLNADVALVSNAGASAGGNISFARTVSNDAADAAAKRTLSITAGAGSVSFGEAVGTGGNTLPLDSVTINSANAGVTISAAMKAGTVGITETGDVAINGPVTVTGAAPAFSSTTGTYTGTSTFTSATAGTITATGSGGITIDHTDAVSLGGALNAAGGGNIDIDSGAALGINAAVSTLNTAGGTITIDSTGMATLAAGANVTAGTGAISFGYTKGGELTTSANISTTAGDIIFARDVTVGGSGVSITSGTTSGGEIQFSRDIRGASGPNHHLTITTSNNVTVTGLIGDNAGTPASLGNLTINGKIIALNGIGTDTGTPAPGAQTLALTASDLILLPGKDYVTSGSQTLTSESGGVLMGALPTAPPPPPVTPPATGGSWGSTAPAGTITLQADTDLYVDMSDPANPLTPDAAVKFISPIECRDFVFYRGTVNLNAKTLRARRNFVVFGPNYDPSDRDWKISFPAYDNDRFDYYEKYSLLHDPYPTHATVPPVHIPSSPYTPPPPPAIGSYTAAFSDLSGSTIHIGSANPLPPPAPIDVGNFYVNGTSMTGTGPWTLRVPASTGTDPAFNGTNAVTPAMWGSPYAVAFNMEVQNSDASSGGRIVAVGPVYVSPYVPALPVPSGTTGLEENNNYVLASGDNPNWRFERPEIVSVEAVRDNLLYITFSEDIENTNNEISAVVGADVNLHVTTNIDVITPTTNHRIFYRTLAGDLDDPNFPHNLVSTDSQGDLRSFYLTTAADFANPSADLHTWRTDAAGTSGGTSTSPGGADSTDSQGRKSGNYGTTLPNLAMPKGRFVAALGGALSVAYGKPGFPSYTAIIDKMTPVLYKIEAGRAAHNRYIPAPAPTAYDAHNFFDLYYSEPVNIGQEPGLGLSAAEAAVPATAAQNIRAGSSFSSAASHGGYIHSSGANVVVEGYFSYPQDSQKTLIRESRDDNPVTDSLYRPDQWRLRIFLSGWSFTTSDPAITDGRLWPGSHGQVSDPLNPARPVALIPNAYITDRAAHPVTGVSGPNSFAGLGTNTIAAYSGADLAFINQWDVDPPMISQSQNDPAFDLEYEIIAVDNAPLNPNVVRLDFFIQDNRSENNSWYSNPVHPDMRPEQRGVRDSTLFYPGFDGFRSINIGRNGDPNPRNVYNVRFSTDVDNSVFNGAALTPQQISNDAYFSLELINTPWLPRDALVVQYNHAEAYITDLAGNLLPTETVPLPAYDNIPPKILVSLAPAGGSKVYVRFSEMVFGSSANLSNQRPVDYRREILPTDFSFTGTSRRVTNIEFLLWGNPSGPNSSLRGVREAFLTLDGPLTPDEAVNVNIVGYAPPTVPEGVSGLSLLTGALYDYRGNRMDYRDADNPENMSNPGRPITDVGMGIVSPLWAFDGFDFDGKTPALSNASLRQFDGTGRLRPADTILQARIEAATQRDETLTLYYDADVPPEYRGSGEYSSLWLPLGVEGITAKNEQARNPHAYEVIDALRTFMIPSADAENSVGHTIEFVFLLNTPKVAKRPQGLPIARLLNPDDPRSIAPWSFRLEAPIVQRAGVSIYNNVINPKRGEKALLTYTLRKAGMVTVNVFSLDGSLVSVLHRGGQSAGEYNFFWDGRNMGGRVVARGIYFVRVVGPGIDEIRKVMVVK